MTYFITYFRYWMLASICIMSCSLALAQAEGTVDTTFADNGFSVENFGVSRSLILSVNVMENGQFYATGPAGNPGGLLALTVKHNADGSYDQDFGDQGGAYLLAFPFSAIPSASVLQPDGKIVFAGTQTSGGIDALMVGRFTADGQLDNSFSGDGYIRSNLGSRDGYLSVGLQSDGRIVAGGRLNGQVLLGRYLTDGTLDPDFGDNGYVQTPYGGDATARSMAVLPDDRILTVGSDDGRLAMGRYLSDGQLDTTFGQGGKVSMHLGYDQFAIETRLSPDGTYLVTGSLFNVNGNGKDDIYVAKFQASGVLDSTFGNQGIVAIDFDGNDDDGGSLDIDAEGRIIVAGESYRANAYEHMAVARLLPDGQLDTTFRDSGQALIPVPGFAISGAYQVRVDAEGSIILGGYAGSSAWNPQFAVVKLMGSAQNTTDFILPQAPQNFSLSVYPNPVIAQATLKLELQEADRLSTKLVDQQGRTVQVITSEQHFSPGMHELPLNIAALSSGLYHLVAQGQSGAYQVITVRKE